MNNQIINETNSRLNEIIEDIRYKKEELEDQLKENQKLIDNELDKVNGYKTEFNEAKKKIQKMTDDINGFEEEYNNLVEKFKDDELANILSGVSKEIEAKIKEKKRNIQRDQDEMNQLVDQAKEAKTELVKLMDEKQELKATLKQINDVYTYYDEEFEKISTYTQENFNNLHPDVEEVEEEVDSTEEDINLDELDINDEEVEINISVDDETDEVQEEEEIEETTDEEVVEEEPQEEIVEEPTEEETTQEEVVEESIPDESEFNVDNIVANDDLEDDDETSIRDFLNKDEDNLF